MMTYAADPEGQAYKNLVATVKDVVTEDSYRCDVDSGPVLPRDHPMHKRAAAITGRLLTAATAVMQEKAGMPPLQMQHRTRRP